MNITPNELAVLKAIDDSCYGDYLTDAIWTWDISDGCGLKKSSFSGVVSSLTKKGLVYSGDEGTEDATIEMTSEGANYYIELVGKDNVNKVID